jgi:RNA polymerase sigma factor (sigma-70 family)
MVQQLNGSHEALLDLAKDLGAVEEAVEVVFAEHEGKVEPGTEVGKLEEEVEELQLVEVHQDEEIADLKRQLEHFSAVAAEAVKEGTKAKHKATYWMQKAKRVEEDREGESKALTTMRKQVDQLRRDNQSYRELLYVNVQETDVLWEVPGWDESIIHDQPPTPEDEVAAKQCREIINRLLSTLTAREEKVLRMIYYGDMTLRGTGQEFEVSCERIRQIEAKALRKLRHPARSKLIKAFAGFEQAIPLLDYPVEHYRETPVPPKKKPRKKRTRKKARRK